MALPTGENLAYRGITSDNAQCIAYRGFVCGDIVVIAWREIVKFTLYISRIAGFNIER